MNWKNQAKKYVEKHKIKYADIDKIALELKRKYYREYQKKNKEKLQRYNHEYYLNDRYRHITNLNNDKREEIEVLYQ